MGIEPTTTHKSALKPCEASIIPLDQAPFVVVEQMSGLIDTNTDVAMLAGLRDGKSKIFPEVG